MQLQVGGTFREPAYLTDKTYADGSSYNTVGITESLLQNEFEEMIKSVEQYKGFYVGRYETSLDETTKVAGSKYGKQAATAAEDSANTWYGSYQKQKEYSSKNTSLKDLSNIVGSSMIWGSQYDQMMIWMQKNEIDVKGNIGDNRNLGKDNDETAVGTTGTTETDKINNVYDLYGNGREGTLEANNTLCRVSRGGCYNETLGYNSPSYRYNYEPYYAGASHSSRLTLYIK